MQITIDKNQKAIIIFTDKVDATKQRYYIANYQAISPEDVLEDIENMVADWIGKNPDLAERIDEQWHRGSKPIPVEAPQKTKAELKWELKRQIDFCLDALKAL